MPSAVGQFVEGAGLLARGVTLCARRPRLLVLGLIPAAVTAALFIGAFVVLGTFLSDLSSAATWFAGDWPEGLRAAARLTASAAILGLSGLLGVLAFTAVTLLIGDPFYEKISEHVEDHFGGIPDGVEPSFWSGLRRNLADSLRLVSLSVLIGVPLFLCGFIPVVGQVVAPIVGAAVGGWFVAVELVGGPFARRDLGLADRRAALGAHRPLALGFGVAAFACFLVPLGAVLLMPGAVAGATLLTRRVLVVPSQ